MRKLVVGYLILMLLVLVGSYYFQETIHRNIKDNEAIVQIRVTNDGALERYTVGLADETGRVYKDFANSRFGGASYPVDIATKQLVIRSADRSQLLATIPLDLVGRELTVVNVDLARGTVTDTISIQEYIPGVLASLGVLEYLLILALFLGIYVGFVILPLSVIAMLLTTILEILAGVKRRFAGSWFNFIVGCGFILLYYPAIMRLFENQEKGVLFYYFMGLFVAGYPLYFMAHRVFNKAEVDAERNYMNWKIWAGAFDYTYTETVFSDGSTESDEVASAAASIIGTIIFFILRAILLPLSTYFHAFLYFLLPLLYGDRTWRMRSTIGRVRHERRKEERVLEPVSDPVSLDAVKGQSLQIGSTVYARYSGDNWFYLGRVDEIGTDAVKVTFFDNVTEWVQPDGIRGVDYAATHMKPHGNWQNRGQYYPCTIHDQAHGGFQVTYDQDGLRESVTPAQLRFC